MLENKKNVRKIRNIIIVLITIIMSLVIYINIKQNITKERKIETIATKQIENMKSSETEDVQSIATIAAIELGNGTIIPEYKPEWSIDEDENEIYKVYIDEEYDDPTTTEIESYKVLRIILKGSAYKMQDIENTNVSINYASDVISKLKLEDIQIFMDRVKADEEWTDVTDRFAIKKADTDKTLPMKELIEQTGEYKNEAGKIEIKYELILYNFEEVVRQSGKKYKELSGNVKLKIKGRGQAEGTYNEEVLTDKYGSSVDGSGNVTTGLSGNHSMMETDESGTWRDVIFGGTRNTQNANGVMFADFIKPEFTYEFSETTINKDDKVLTVVFYAMDKYFDETNSSLQLSDLTVTVGGQTIEVNNSTEPDVNKRNTLTDQAVMENEAGVRIGTKYTLVVKNLQQKPSIETDNENDGFSYSGIVQIAIPANKFKDYSGNGNNAKTITVGLDDPTNPDHDGNPEEEDNHTSGEIVDVVDPVWKIPTDSIDIDFDNDAVTFDLIATDKYYSSDTLTSGIIDDLIPNNKMLLYIDGVETTNITKTLIATEDLEPARTGVKYTIKLSDWDADEYTGTTKIVIPEEIIIDQYGNSSVRQQFTIGHIDFTKPVIEKTDLTEEEKEQIEADDAANNTETIVFKATDKYFYVPTDEEIAAGIPKNEVTLDEITVKVDGEEVTAIQKPTTTEEQESNKDKIWMEISHTDITEERSGTTHTIGHNYTLILSNFEHQRTSINRTREFSDWSGTVQIVIDEGAVKDKEVTTNPNGETSGGNVNDETTIDGDFVDFIKPNVTYEYSSTDIVRNHEDKTLRTFTMVFDITDKYFENSAFATELEPKILELTNLKDELENTTTDEDKNEIKAQIETIESECLEILQKYLTIWVDEDNITNIDTVTKKIIAIENVTATMNKTTNVTNKTIESVTNAIIGKRFTLEISGLEQEKSTAIGENYLDYSGMVSVAFNSDQPIATDTTGNVNNSGTLSAPSIISGVNNPDGTGTGTIVDLVDPIWEQADTAEARPYQKYAKIVVKGTDKYIATNNLQSSDIKIIVTTPDGIVEVDGDQAPTQGMTLTITQDTSVTLSHGKQYIIELEGYSADAYQVKLILKDGILVDQSGNTSQETEFVLFSSLLETSTETEASSEFLAQNKKEGQTIPQRQYIEQVIFKDNLDGINETKWDVSQLNDETIWAWYTTRTENGTTLYTVYIGSYIIINGNVNSSYLFANIGRDTNCKITGDTTNNEIIENLDLLHVDSVTDMSHMFEDCGYANMQSLDLGSQFDTRSVTNMSDMFVNCGNEEMTILDLGEKFDTSKVTDMSNMFNGCGQNKMTTFKIGSATNNTVDINTTLVTNMSGMFRNFGQKLGNLVLGENFDTSKVTNMSNMFNATGKTSMTAINIGNKFNTAKVQNMSGMFQDFGQTAITCLDLGDLFYTTSATDMNNMFNGCGTNAMTILDLGPAFTKIVNLNTNFVTNCGTTDCVIYAPESIYNDNTHLKLNGQTAKTTDYTTGTTIQYTQGTINPVYKPEWEEVLSTLEIDSESETGTMTIIVNALANKIETPVTQINYISEVTTSVNSNHITVYVDREEASGINKAIVTNTRDTEITDGSLTYKTNGDIYFTDSNNVTHLVGKQYKVTLTNFVESFRQSGKNFKEWSGNISLQFAEGTVKDKYGSSVDGEGNVTIGLEGNQNLAELNTGTTEVEGNKIFVTEKIVVEDDESLFDKNQAGEAHMFADVKKPEFTYEYANVDVDTNANTVIDYVNKKVTVVFDVTDKYFKETDLATDTNAQLIKVLVDNELPGDINANGVIDEDETLAITKTLAKKTIGEEYTVGNIIYETDGDICYTVNGVRQKIGERYELVISKLEQTPNDGFDFSGIITLGFDRGIIKDKSGNVNNAKTITIGIDDPNSDVDNSKHPGHDEGVIVDVVDPVWEVKNQSTTTTMVNGKPVTTATMELIATDKHFKESKLVANDIQIMMGNVNIVTIAPELQRTFTGPEYIKWDPNTKTYVTATQEEANAQKYVFTVSNLEESYTAFLEAREDGTRVYREYSGPTSIVIPAGTTEVVEGVTTLKNGILDESGNLNKAFTIDLDNIDTLKPQVVKVSSQIIKDETNIENSKQQIVFDITDKYFNTSAISTSDTSKIHVYVDGVETTKVTKTITNIEELTAIVDGVDQIVGYRYTLELSNFKQTRTTISDNVSDTTGTYGDYTELSGTVSIKIDANTATDKNSITNEIINGNDETEILGDFVDFIRPDVTYKYWGTTRDATPSVNPSSDINYTNKTFKMVFDLTDKYFDTSTLTTEMTREQLAQYLTIMLAGTDITTNPDIDITIASVEDVKAKGTVKKTTDTVVNRVIAVNGDTIDKISDEIIASTITTAGKTHEQVLQEKVVQGEIIKQVTDPVIGKRITLLFKNLEQATITSGEYLNYSGVISVVVKNGTIVDKSDNTNLAETTTLVSGVDKPNDGNGTNTGTIVDVVDPLWEKVSSSANAIDPNNPESSTATITIKGTDKYFNTSAITQENIKNYIKVYAQTGTDGTTATDVTSSVNLIIDETSDIKDTVDGVENVVVGKQYTITITGFAQDVNQIKIEIQPGTMTDKSGNGNKVTQMLLHNVLRLTNTETVATSAFLGNSSIERQNIENVTFLSSTATVPQTGWWDASAARDNSIKAWATQTTTQQTNGTYTVYIASDDEIFANQNSSYLFYGIGRSENCTATETITNLNLLNTSSVTNMKSMFNRTGYTAMTKLDLGTNFDTRNVTNMAEMFYNTGNKVMTTFDLGTKFDTTKVTDMNQMFFGCGSEKLQKLDLRTSYDSEGNERETIKFNTSKVTNMQGMFNSCGKNEMTTFDIGEEFDTGEVTNMSEMFYAFGQAKLSQLDLGSLFDTKNVTTMEKMFYYCGNEKLEELDLGDLFDTSNVTTMNSMFYRVGTVEMTSIDLGQKFNTSKVTDMYRMFYHMGENKLESLDLGDLFYTTSVTNMEGMFLNTGNKLMTTLDLGPVFTRIAETNTDFVTNTGKPGTVIYAPETIYNAMKQFKLNADSATTIQYTQGTINPIYKPEWALVSNTLNTSTGIMTIVVKGSANKTFTNGEYTGRYASDVTSILPVPAEGETVQLTGEQADLINIYVDEELSKLDTNADGILDTETIVKTITNATSTTNETTGKTEVQYTITLDLEDIIRRSGKNFLEWSGNISVQFAKGILRDKFGSYLNTDAQGKTTPVVNVFTDTSGNYVGNGNRAEIDIDTSGTIEKILLDDEDKDALLNANTSNPGTDADLFSDTIEPEFTYEYSETTIGNGPAGDKKVKIVFDVTDKYFESTQLSSDQYAELITVQVAERTLVGDTDKDGIIDRGEDINLNGRLDEGEDLNGNGTLDLGEDIRKTLTKTGIFVMNKATKVVTVKSADYIITDSNTEQKVGERYELLIEGLQSIDGVGYSGPMTFAFGQGIIQDLSGNKNIDKSITIGIDDPTNHPEHNTPVIVDVVNPIWTGPHDVNTINRTNDTVSITILGSDKYYASNTLDEDKITVYVDETVQGTISKTLIEITDTEQLATLAANAGLPSDVEVIGYTLTLGSFGNISGETKIVIEPGTIVDDSNNQNLETTIFAGNINWEEENEPLEEGQEGYPKYPAFRQDIVDFIDPVITYTHSTVEGSENPDIDYEEKTVTVKFTVTDKHILESSVINTDGTLNTTLVTINVDNEDVTDKVRTNISSIDIQNGKEYTLVISNIQQTPNNAFDFSGPMQLIFALGTINDTSGNQSAATTITLDTTITDDVLDVVDPIIYHDGSIINRTAKTVTLYLRADDKYIASQTFSDAESTVKVKVIESDGTISHVNGTVTSSTGTVIVNDTTTITKEIERTDRDLTSFYFEVVLSDFGINEGVTSVIIPENVILDTSGNGNIETEILVGDSTNTTAFKDSIVDFTKPTWEYVTSSIQRNREGETGTVTLEVKGTDIYFDKATYFDNSANELDLSDVKVYVNDVENTTISKAFAAGTYKEYVEETDANGRTLEGVKYKIVLGNFGTNEGTVRIEIPENAIKDTSTNGNILTSIDVGNPTWVETDVEPDVDNPKYLAFRDDIVDYIKPIVRYQYANGTNPVIDRTNKQVSISFNVTDTNFLESDIQFNETQKDIQVFVDVGGNEKDVTDILDGTLTSVDYTNGTIRGKTYTLTLSGFEQDSLLADEVFLRHSGVIKLVVKKDTVYDSSGNSNIKTTMIIDQGDGDGETNGTLDLGEDLNGNDILDAGEDATGVIVDFIKPTIVYHSKYINWQDRYAEVTIRATDRFYDTSTTLEPTDITLYEQNDDGDYVQINDFNGKTEITRTPLYDVDDNLVGYDYKIKLKDFEEEFKMRINIPANKMGDTSGNYNDEKDIDVDLDNRRPTWEYVSTDTTNFASDGTVIFNVKGVDKFLNIARSGLTVENIKVIKDGEIYLDGTDAEDAAKITVSYNAAGSSDTEKSKAYSIQVTGLTEVGTYSLVIEDGTLFDEFNNINAATTITLSKSVLDSNTANYTNVTYHVTPDFETVHKSYVHELMSVNTTGTNFENTTYRPSTLGELHNDGENPLFAEPMYKPVYEADGYTVRHDYSPQSFAGWAEADEKGNTIYYSDASLTTVSTTQTAYTRVYGLYDEIPSTITHLKAVWQNATVVFVSASDGNNSNDGQLPTSPVSDLATAYSKLNSSGTSTNNIIVIMDAIVWNSNTTLTGNATITSLYAGVDYRATKNAELKISSNMVVNGDVIFDNIELYADSTTVSDGTNYLANGTYTNMLISNYSGDITLGRQITTPEGKYTFGAVIGGNYKTEATGSFGTHTVRVEAGKYNNIIAGSTLTSSTTTSKFVTHEVVIGNMKDTAIQKNDKLTITGYVAIGENEKSNYPDGSSGSDNGYMKTMVNVTLYSGTFTGVNKFVKSSENAVIYLRSINGETDGIMTFNMFGGDVTSNIYGGARTEVLYPTNNYNTMNFYGGELTGNIFGQGATDAFMGSSTITLQGCFNMTGNVFGGSNATTAGSGNGNTSISIDSSSVTVNGNIYGGSNGINNSGYITGNTAITLNAGTVGSIYGSGNNSGNTGTTTIIIENGTVSGNIIGGAYNGQGGATATTTVLGGTVTGNIYGGNENTSQTYMDNDTVSQDVTITIGDVDETKSPTINGVIYGSGKYDKLDNVEIQLIECETVPSVFGGADANFTTATANIYLKGMTVNEIYGGGQEAGTVATANIDLISGTATDVYGGGYAADVTTSNISLEGTVTVESIYGGSNSGGTVTESNVILTSGNVTNVFGGGNSGTVGTANVELNGITIEELHGGSKNAGVTTETNVTLTSGTVTSVFGGGLDVGVITSNIIHTNDVTVTNIYGGNNSTVVGTGGDTGTTNITIENSEVTNVYGGNYLKGTTNTSNITITGTSTITGKLYGGGYKSDIGKSTENGNTTINISGGTINKDIFGGSEDAKVYGNTTVNIGRDATGNPNLAAGNIIINGTIYGAGSTTNSDYSYISVEGDTHVTLDNSSYTPIEFSGSIFGSGKGSTYSTSGTETDESTIKIQDVGTSTDSFDVVSIERTGKLYIGNSFIQLSGRQDTNNEDTRTSYTLNRITDGLTVYNNTTLYTQRGFNMVGGFNSYKTFNFDTNIGTKATADITAGTVTKNVDNRIYAFEGINLIFAKEEGNIYQYATTTDNIWGEINGMTFFGMYAINRTTGKKEFDIYDPTDTSGAELGFFSNGTFIEGQHETNHNTAVDGFYTNVADYTDPDNIEVTPQIIDVIDGGNYYDWIIGADIVNYNISLIASASGKESMEELTLAYKYEPNATYTFDRASLNALNTDINLINPLDIPVVSGNANKTFGLTMETDNVGWLNNAKTNIYTASNGSFDGDTLYNTDNTSTPGTVRFKLHNSVNITEQKDLGNVNLKLVGKTSNNTFIVIIAVNLQTIVEEESGYEPRFTNSRETELHYTSDSKVDLTYTLYKDELTETPYTSGMYRVLTTTEKLPAGTRITMKDLAQGKVYYYHVTGSETSAEYKLSNFLEMDSIDNYYTDSSTYYNSTNQYVVEKYEISIDYLDANISGDKLLQEAYLELRNSDGSIVYDNGTTEVEYNLYSNKNAIMTETISNEAQEYSVVEDAEITFTLSVSIAEQTTASGKRIMDTKYYDKKSGIVIEILDANNQRVKLPEAQNVTITNVDDATEEYAADESGVIRIPLMDTLSSVTKKYKMTISQYNVAPGRCSVNLYLFSSDDGEHLGDEEYVGKHFYAMFVNKLLGLVGVEATDDSRIISSSTGLNLEGNSGIDMSISLGDPTEESNLRVELYKRNPTYTNINDETTYTGTSYTLVNIEDYLQGTWQTPEEADEGLISEGSYQYVILPRQTYEDSVEIHTIDLERALKANIATGEYKLVIKSYHNNILIQTVRKTFVVTQ